jgi:3-oxoacyl-[acyl-carrier protein] reductase
MTQVLAGRVAVVTGGAGGIGRVVIAALCEMGATAVSLDITEPQPCDVRDDASVAAAIARVVHDHKRLDIAIHAAGIARDGVVWKLTLDDWDAVQQVNLRGAFSLLRHSIPAMRRAGGGRIVLIGSINGSRGKLGTSAYSASKAGLLGLAKSVSREVGRFGILVNVVEPGWVETPMSERLPQSIKDAAIAETLLGQLVEPQDVASAVAFLCGPGARRITGQILRVDAGQYL